MEQLNFNFADFEGSVIFHDTASSLNCLHKYKFFK